jgi:hypothetical protein
MRNGQKSEGVPKSLADHGDTVGDVASFQVGRETSLYMERVTTTPHDTLPASRCVDGTPTESVGDGAHLWFVH